MQAPDGDGPRGGCAGPVVCSMQRQQQRLPDQGQPHGHEVRSLDAVRVVTALSYVGLFQPLPRRLRERECSVRSSVFRLPHSCFLPGLVGESAFLGWSKYSESA
eukprot:7861078-Pyramimonas_sp.AAC.1